MFLGVGVGAYADGIFHLVTHAFFKALLFLGAGSVIHVLHHAYHASHRHEDAQDMRNMGGLSKYMPWTTAVMWVATLAIAGVPPFSGFCSKDEILSRAFERGHEAGIYYVYWVFGSVAALLTAFYMTRLMLYTFHGPNRTGEQERQHLREAPWVMTAPLVVLALGAVGAGALNLPAILPGSGWLEQFLEPVTAVSAFYLPEGQLGAGTEWSLLILATGGAAAGIFGAWVILKPAALKAAREAPAERGWQLVVARKYYVDELYDAVVVRPLVWFSDRVLWRTVDAFLIDGVAVNGAARVMRFVGWMGSQLQTGQVGVYVVLFIAGALVILRAVLGVW